MARQSSRLSSITTRMGARQPIFFSVSVVFAQTLSAARLLSRWLPLVCHLSYTNANVYSLYTAVARYPSRACSFAGRRTFGPVTGVPLWLAARTRRLVAFSLTPRLWIKIAPLRIWAYLYTSRSCTLACDFSLFYSRSARYRTTFPVFLLPGISFARTLCLTTSPSRNWFVGNC